jgi:hypothetical protein
MAYLNGTTRLGLYGGPGRQYAGFDAATASAAITGTVGDGALESEIVSTGGTIIITLTNDTWVASGAAFDAQRQNIIDGLDAAASPATGWNTLIRDVIDVSTVARTSDTVVTITIPATGAYAIDADETITVTVPATALVTSGTNVTATPTITITAATELPRIALRIRSGITMRLV